MLQYVQMALQMTGKNKWARHKSTGWAKEQAGERCPQIDYTGQVMQVLLLLLINFVSCYVNVQHGLSVLRPKVQGSWDCSLNKDAAQTAWNGVCVCVSASNGVMMDANRMKMKSQQLFFCRTDTSLSKPRRLRGTFSFASPKPPKISSCSNITYFQQLYPWFWLSFISAFRFQTFPFYLHKG